MEDPRKSHFICWSFFLITTHEFAQSAGFKENNNLVIRSPGPNGRYLDDPTWQEKIEEDIQEFAPNLVVTIHQFNDNFVDFDNTWLKTIYQNLGNGQVGVVVDAAVTPRWQAWMTDPIEDDQTRGDLAVGTTCQHFAEPLVDWCNQPTRYDCPKSIDTIDDSELLGILQSSLQDALEHIEAEVAFPAEARQEAIESGNTLGAIVDSNMDLDVAISDPEQPLVDSELLDDLPLEGFPVEEAARRREWSRVPRKARIAIRRLHNMLGHKPKDVMIQILKGAKASDDLVSAARNFKCDACSISHEGDKTHPVAAPPKFEFNHTVIIDVFETHDDKGDRHSWLSIVCSGTCFHQVIHVAEGGQPSSGKCLAKFTRFWASWAGFPRVVCTDRGLHNRGAFAKGMSDHGVQIRTAGLESPEHIGRGERHGGIVKRTWRRVCRQLLCVGKEQAKTAMASIVSEKNDYIRHGGFSPSQWVIGKRPRGIAELLDEDEFANLGSIQSSLDGATAFGRIAEIRHRARKALVHQDCSHRVKSSLLRKSAPLPGKYSAGDLVCYRINRVQGQAGRAEPQWSSVCKIIGFDNKTLWVVHEGVPVATSLAKLRPCTSAEALAFSILNKTAVPGQDPGDVHEEQRYIEILDTDGELPIRPAQRRRLAIRDEAEELAIPLPQERRVERRISSTESRARERAESRASAAESRASEPDSEGFPTASQPSELHSRKTSLAEPMAEEFTSHGSDALDHAAHLGDLLQKKTDEIAHDLQKLFSSLGKYKKPSEEFRCFIFMAERLESQAAESWLRKRKKKYVSAEETSSRKSFELQNSF